MRELHSIGKDLDKIPESIIMQNIFLLCKFITNELNVNYRTNIMKYDKENKLLFIRYTSNYNPYHNILNHKFSPESNSPEPTPGANLLNGICSVAFNKNIIHFVPDMHGTKYFSIDNETMTEHQVNFFYLEKNDNSNLKSILSIPISNGSDEKIGVLNIDSNEMNHFNANKQKVLLDNSSKIQKLFKVIYHDEKTIS